MPVSSVTVIERSVDKAYEWLNQLADELGSPGDRHYAYRVLRAVLHTLRDRMPVESIAHLGAQLPELIRGIYYEDWRPATSPLPYHHATQFLDRVAAEADLTGETQAGFAVAGVARMLHRHVTAGELAHVRAALPTEISALLAEP